jgi:hypothetical protein
MSLKNIVTAKSLEGYRTYIIMGIIFISGGLKALGYIDDSVYENILKLFGPLGIITLAMRYKKEEVTK